MNVLRRVHQKSSGGTRSTPFSARENRRSALPRRARALANRWAGGQLALAACRCFLVHLQASTSSGPEYYARAVLVDMEPKVVQGALRHAKRHGKGTWAFDSRRTFSRQSGSGNNWAAGYCTHGPDNMVRPALPAAP